MRAMFVRNLFLTLALSAAALSAPPLPRIVHQAEKFQLLVDGKPFLLLGAQVHNSNAWPSVLSASLPQVAALHANTVEIPVYWEDIEPRPGEFDFTNVDAVIKLVRENHLRMVLLWFGTWKNGQMDYAPSWVKSNNDKYPRMIDSGGKPVKVLSPLFPATRDADVKAFTTLLRHIRDIDEDTRTVIMVQVENEPGSLDTTRDYSPTANRLFDGPVPAAVLEATHKSGANWQRAFGPDADEFFAAWAVASYVEAVAKAGKQVYPLPFYVNVWLRERKNFMRPGDAYPSGGATNNVLDIWKALTPSLDAIAPDIYVPDYIGYQEVCKTYGRKDNPLMVPETGGSNAVARYMFYALGDYGALSFAPFGVDTPGIDELPIIKGLSANFKLFAPLVTVFPQWQAERPMKSMVEEEFLVDRLVEFDKWQVLSQFGSVGPGYGGLYATGTKERTGRALAVDLGNDEFIIMGFDARVTFRPRYSDKKTQYLRVEQGTFENGEWKVRRLLNGDQTFFALILPPDGTILKVKVATY